MYLINFLASRQCFLTMVDFRMTWTVGSLRLGMQIAFGRVRRKTAPTREWPHIFRVYHSRFPFNPIYAFNREHLLYTDL